MRRKVLIISEDRTLTYHRPFKAFGELTTNSELLWSNPKQISLVVFTGGADISPSLYGQEAARGTLCVPRRDIYESITYQKALQLKKPIAGICRGAQFLNVMAGGSLVQHLEGHQGYHDMTTFDGRCFEVSSTHHQMMLIPQRAFLIGWASKRRAYNYYDGKDRIITPEPKYETEVVYWPYIRAVGMQYHPESMGEFQQGFKFAEELVHKYLKVDI